MPGGNIMYKTLGFKWLFEISCPASAFVSADRDEARNPQRFIHVTVTTHFENGGTFKMKTIFQVLLTFIYCYNP